MKSNNAMGTLSVIFIIFLFQMLFIAAMLPVKILTDTGKQESELVRQFLGEETALTLRKKSDELFNRWFNETGIVKETFKTFIPTEKQKKNSKGMEDLGGKAFTYAEQRLTVMWTAVYLGIHRVLSIVMWLPGFIPFLMAAGFDAWKQRKVKMLNFASPSASIYGTCKTILWASMIAPIMIALFPFPVPPVAAPLWCATVVIAFGGILVNWPRN